MAKRSYKRAAQNRDAGAFLAVPVAVLDSPAYLSLSPAAVKLLWDVASQLRGDNNGHLYCAWVVMEKRGWKSQTTLMKAKTELLQAQLLFETRKGARPNRAAWYAVTWLALDAIVGMDSKPAVFPRGAYRHHKNEALTPVSGVGAPRIAPVSGVGEASATPVSGAISAVFTHLSTPVSGVLSRNTISTNERN